MNKLATKWRAENSILQSVTERNLFATSERIGILALVQKWRRKLKVKLIVCTMKHPPIQCSWFFFLFAIDQNKVKNLREISSPVQAMLFIVGECTIAAQIKTIGHRRKRYCFAVHNLKSEEKTTKWKRCDRKREQTQNSTHANAKDFLCVADSIKWHHSRIDFGTAETREKEQEHKNTIALRVITFVHVIFVWIAFHAIQNHGQKPNRVVKDHFWQLVKWIFIDFWRLARMEFSVDLRQAHIKMSTIKANIERKFRLEFSAVNTIETSKRKRTT